MNEYSSHRGNGAMLGFMFGALVGAATALLLAPATGEETRKKLAESTRRLRDQGQDLAEKARTKIGQFREQGQELAEKARTKYDQIRHETTGARTPGQGVGPQG